MNNLLTRNVAYIGLLSGLTLVVICLLTPLAKGMVVWYQLMAVLVAGVVLGFLFRDKIPHSFAITIHGLLYSLAITGIFYFVNEKTPIRFSIFVTVTTILFFLLGNKFFSLKMNKILQHAIAIFGFLILFFVIPVIMLLVARATYSS